jgi:ABC-type Zn uptake system ZnuABC Zn-binding protein ZnuA
MKIKQRQLMSITMKRHKAEGHSEEDNEHEDKDKDKDPHIWLDPILSIQLKQYLNQEAF